MHAQQAFSQFSIYRLMPARLCLQYLLSSSMPCQQGFRPDHIRGTCRFSDLNLPPKNWTFPCTVATLGEIKVQPRLVTCLIPSQTGRAGIMTAVSTD